MIKMTITLEAPDKESLLREINTLMGAAGATPMTEATPAPVMEATTEEEPQAPAEQPKATAVPTAKKPAKAAEPAITRDQLATALVALQDSGQGAEVLKIINSFGAPSLAAIDPGSYGAVAQAIRNAGGSI